MTSAPLELISAYPWRRTAFTTYALSLSFFEAVILDSLVRGGGREALILADVKGVSAALAEQGARRVGKDYDVEPFVVRSGAGIFHPKISVLSSEDDSHVLVGSGNLTFGGWGGNFEVIEHLHSSFASDAIGDIADFFEKLAVSSHVGHGAVDRCAAIAADLRMSTRGKTRNGDIRLFHSLGAAISQQLVQVAEDLGGAVRLVAAAPFWDGGAAIDELCGALGLQEVFVHAHVGGSVEGIAGSNWPARAAVRVHAIQLEIMNEAKPRRLHAKVFEILCKRGRILLSGSANATHAALSKDRNVESCVARIERQLRVGWKFAASEPPQLQLALEDESKNDGEQSGVLRAVLENGQVVGQVLTPVINGVVTAYQLTTEGAVELGAVLVGPNAKFCFAAPGLEVQSWKGSRLVLQLRGDDGRRTEGFISVAAFAEITRRAGGLAQRLFAVIAGTETPADVAAIMSWFNEDPRRLTGNAPMPIGGGADASVGEETPDHMVMVAELNIAHATRTAMPDRAEDTGAASWRRFMENVFAAFRERRGPFGSTAPGRIDDDDEDNIYGGNSVSGHDDPAVVRSLAMFERLLNLWLKADNAPRFAITAFDLTQYVCERLQPDADRVKAWLDRLLTALSSGPIPKDRREDVAAAVLVLSACDSHSEYVRSARAQLLRLGLPVSGQAPSSEHVQGFQSVLIQKVSFAELWDQVKAARTFPEQVKAYLSAFDKGQPSGGYEDLALAAPEEWPVLEAAFSSQDSRRRITVVHEWSEACPIHHITLPSLERSKLRTVGIATAKNCRQFHIIIYAGG